MWFLINLFGWVIISKMFKGILIRELIINEILIIIKVLCSVWMNWFNVIVVLIINLFFVY